MHKMNYQVEPECESLIYIEKAVSWSTRVVGILDESNKIPVTAFTTKCDDIQKEDLVVELSQTTANFTVRPERRQYLCLFNPSHPKIEPGVQLNDYLSYPESYKINLKNLKPFEKYTFNVNIGNKQITKSFQTLEGIPEKVQNLNGKPISDTAIELNWEPGRIWGHLEQYIVKYQFAQYLVCESDALTYESEITITTAAAPLTLHNLNPYSKHLFSVAAKNTEYTGEWQTIFVDTPQSETISKDEIPELESRKIQARSVQLKFLEIACSKLRGPISIMITIQCSEPWCTKENTKEIEYTVGKSISVLPFTNYIFIFKFCRSKTICSPYTKQETFKSDVEPPYAVNNLSVYSKNRSSISVRWQPPYPPTGIVELYNIQSTNHLNLRKNFGNVSNSPCRLWPDFQCFTISNLGASQKYSIELRAKNEKHDNFGLLTTSEAVTITEQSEPPTELKKIWTLENDLRIKWKHPTKANGDISSFKISVIYVGSSKLQNYEIFSVTEDQYRSEYEHFVPANKLLTSTEYKISVQAYNGLDGKPAYLIVSSPPEIPIFEKEPTIQRSNHSIEIETFKINNFNSRNHYKLFLLLLDDEAETVSQPVELEQLQKTFNIKLSKFKSLYECSSYKDMEKFVIGENSNKSTTNCKSGPRLVPTLGTHYNVTILLVNTYQGKSSYKFYTYDLYTPSLPPEETKDLSLLALLTLLIIPIPVIIFLLKKNIFRKKTQQTLQPVQVHDNINVGQKIEQVPLIQLHPMRNDTKSTDQIYEPSKSDSKLVSVKNFGNYFKRALETRELKNQYDNVLNSVVSYEPITLKNFRSDYVDMNFNSGIQIKNAYIITKLPAAKEFYEFWKLVVDENICHIILFAHLYPNQKINKSYWPDVGKSIHIGDIIIEGKLCEKYTFYTYRKFYVKCKNKILKIDQLHLSLPPKDSQYLSSLNYVTFFQKMSQLSYSSKSPILVHSSAGLRGSSFALLCDMSIRSAKKDGTIDVMTNYRRLIQITSEMKITFNHYVAVHAIIADTLNHVDTSIQCNVVDERKSQLLTTGEIQKQLQYLKDTLWLDMIPTGKEPEFNKCLLTENSNAEQFYLQVGDFKVPEKFWVTKQPVAIPLSDFLETVQKRKISVIVTLNDNIFNWPDENHPEMVIGNEISLKFKYSKKMRSYHWVTLELTTNTTVQTMEVVTFNNWPASVVSLPKIEDFIHFVSESNEIFKYTELVLVICHNGVTSCGLYLAMSYIIQQTNTENVCDVCGCVRRLRRYCQDFVKDDKQYVFLLEAAYSYMKEFGLYEVR